MNLQIKGFIIYILLAFALIVSQVPVQAIAQNIHITPPTSANPTATAGPTANNGTSPNFMRSDASPLIQKGTDSVFGIIRGDGSTISCASTSGICVVFGIVVGSQTLPPGSTAVVQGNGGKIQLSAGITTLGNCVQYDANGNTIDSGAPCGGSGSVGGNPTATAGPAAVNGVATTYMRSDAAPAIQKASAAQFGIVECDGTTIICTLGVISASLPTAANPTGTAGPTAVNGTATTFMRSDAAPAVQKGTNTVFGIVHGDGSTISCTSTSGICVVAGIVVGGQTLTPGGTAAVQGNGAKIQLSTGTATSGDCVKFDVNGNTTDNGAACATQSNGANPTATAGPTANNGSATTFLRSDASPAVQKGTNSVFGIVEGDGSTISCAVTPGVCIVAGIVIGGQTVVPGGTATVQGNGSKIQLSTGTVVSGNCAKFDANGNIVDNGSSCAGSTSLPYFEAYRSTNQTFAGNTATKVQFNTKDFDSNTWYDNTTNFRFTPQTAGKYLVTVSITFTFPSADGNSAACAIYKNGSNYSQQSFTAPVVASVGTANLVTNTPCSISNIVSFNGSTDYVEGWGIPNSASTSNGFVGLIGSIRQTFFQAQYIAP